MRSQMGSTINLDTTVVGLQGFSISAEPGDGDALLFDGTNWNPVAVLPLTGGTLSNPGALLINFNPDTPLPPTFPATGTPQPPLWIVGNNNAAATIGLDAYGTGGNVSGIIIGRRARGTPAAPTALLANDNVLSLRSQAYNGTAYTNAPFINFTAAENWGPANQGSMITFITGIIGGTSVANSLVLQGNTASFPNTVNLGNFNSSGIINIVALGGNIPGTNWNIQLDGSNNLNFSYATTTSNNPDISFLSAGGMTLAGVNGNNSVTLMGTTASAGAEINLNSTGGSVTSNWTVWAGLDGNLYFSSSGSQTSTLLNLTPIGILNVGGGSEIASNSASLNVAEAGIAYVSIETDGTHHAHGFSWNGALQAWVDNLNNGNLQFQTSDARVKNNFMPIEVNPLEVVNKIVLQQFDWEPQGEYQKPHWSCGYTAQNIQELIPEAVIESKDGPLGVDLMLLISYCIGAIQQLSQQLTRAS